MSDNPLNDIKQTLLDEVNESLNLSLTKANTIFSNPVLIDASILDLTGQLRNSKVELSIAGNSSVLVNCNYNRLDLTKLFDMRNSEFPDDNETSTGALVSKVNTRLGTNFTSEDLIDESIVRNGDTNPVTLKAAQNSLGLIGQFQITLVADSTGPVYGLYWNADLLPEAKFLSQYDPWLDQYLVSGPQNNYLRLDSPDDIIMAVKGSRYSVESGPNEMKIQATNDNGVAVYTMPVLSEYTENYNGVNDCLFTAFGLTGTGLITDVFDIEITTALKDMRGVTMPGGGVAALVHDVDNGFGFIDPDTQEFTSQVFGVSTWDNNVEKTSVGLKIIPDTIDWDSFVSPGSFSEFYYHLDATLKATHKVSNSVNEIKARLVVEGTSEAVLERMNCRTIGDVPSEIIDLLGGDWPIVPYGGGTSSYMTLWVTDSTPSTYMQMRASLDKLGSPGLSSGGSANGVRKNSGPDYQMNFVDGTTGNTEPQLWTIEFAVRGLDSSALFSGSEWLEMEIHGAYVEDDDRDNVVVVDGPTLNFKIAESGGAIHITCPEISYDEVAGYWDPTNKLLISRIDTRKFGQYMIDNTDPRIELVGGSPTGNYRAVLRRKRDNGATTVTRMSCMVQLRKRLPD